MEPERLPSGRTPGLISKFLIRIAGVDPETLSRCPSRDWDYVLLTGLLMLFTGTYLTGLFFALGHHVFDVPWPWILAVSWFFGSYVMLTEVQLVMRPSWFQHRIKVLRVGGLVIDKVIDKTVQLWIAVAIRGAMALSFAQLSALAFGLIVFGPDIASRIHHIWLQDNGALIVEVTKVVDDRIAMATRAVEAERTRLDALSGQVTAIGQNEINPAANDPQTRMAQAEIARLSDNKARADQEVSAAETFAANELGGIKGSPENSGHAGAGPKRRAALERVADARRRAQALATALDAARAHFAAQQQRLVTDSAAARQQAKAQLPEFEQRLAGETARLASLQDQLAKLTDGRETAIRKALEASPAYIPASDGLLGQLAALDAIAHENPRVAAFILVIDVASLCLELSVVMSRSLVFVPTAYAGIIAREWYESAVLLVEEMMAGLRPDRNDPPFPPSRSRPSNDNGPSSPAAPGSVFDGLEDRPPQPPQPPARRGRGPPRKTPPLVN